MAWIYLVESAVSRSRSGLGYELSHIAKTTDTLKASYCLGCGQETLIMPPSRMTCASCGAMRCWGSRSTSFPEGSRARISALRELGGAWRESEADYFSKSYDYVASFDRDSFSWKTSQPSLFGGLTEFSWSSLRWGTIVDGRLYQPQRLEPVTLEKDGSSLVPTPTVFGNHNAPKTGTNRGTGLSTWAKFQSKEGASVLRDSDVWALLQAVFPNRLPTPTASEYGSNQTNTPGGKRRDSLNQMARKGVIPPPMARDWKGSGGDRNSPDLAYMAGGPLNPAFIEEIMGYKIGWTVCEDWATPLFRPKRERRFAGSQELATK